MIDHAIWTFILCDAAGNALADLATASGRTVAYKRNSYAEVNLTISHEDDAAAVLLDALGNSGVPKLRAYRRSVTDVLSSPAPLRFAGPLMALQEASEETSLVTATFRSPFSVLVGDGDKSGRFLTSQFPTIYDATDAGQIAADLIDTANGDSPTGLAVGNITTTTERWATYPPGQNIGSAIVNLSALLDGFDFEEVYEVPPGVAPFYAGGVPDAWMNIVPSLGTVNPFARFEYGPATLNNCQSMQRNTTPPQNSIFLTGANGLTSVYQDTTSVAKYGEWWGHYDLPNVTDQATLDAKARALCRPNPIKTVTIVPDLALSPLPFDDWNLGDTVPFLAARKALQENTQMRINGFTVPIDENGIESTSVDDPTSPEEDAVTLAQLTAEVNVTS